MRNRIVISGSVILSVALFAACLQFPADSRPLLWLQSLPILLLTVSHWRLLRQVERQEFQRFMTAYAVRLEQREGSGPWMREITAPVGVPHR